VPLSLKILDADLDRIAEAFGIDLTHECRREFLKRTASVDVQACPGSGKTTLLVAKLAILADKWSWPDRGICAISHTNVARRELERRLAAHPTGHRLLAFPHFVGTIQTFVNRYLALPYLRSNGISVTQIDNDRFAERAEAMLNWGRFSAVRKTLEMRSFAGDKLLRSLRFRTHALQLDTAGEDIWFGEETVSYKQLLALKETLTREGYFRFDDMYAFAQALIHQMPTTVDAVRHRFPWVFVDEMQDTYDIQEEVLEALFRNTDVCILQRLGDANQAIFGSEVNAHQQTFPCKETANLIGIPDSKRFCQEIADFATPLTVVPQQLVGDAGMLAKQNTVFLFDESTVGSVLDAFCNLVLNEFPGDLPEGLRAKAIGYRRAEGVAADKHIPYCIGYYCPHAGSKPKSPIGQASLIEMVLNARHAASRDCTCHGAKRMIEDGIMHVLKLQGVRRIGDARLSRWRLARWLASQVSQEAELYSEVLAQWSLPYQVLEEDHWNQTCERMRSILSNLSKNEWSASVLEFMGWQSIDNDATGNHSSLPQGRYSFQGLDGRQLEIEITTIHAVKGETHAATLVLETYMRLHDLSMLLPELSGVARIGKKPTSYEDNLRRVFVGMTRTCGLLCLAVHKSDKLQEKNIEGLQSRGWRVVDLTNLLVEPGS